MARAGGAVVTDASETDGVSAAVGLGELSEAVSTGGELVVADSAVGVSVGAALGKLCAVVSTGGELVVADSRVGVAVATGLPDLCKAISIGGELRDSAVAGVGDAATDGVFGGWTRARIAQTSAAPVNTVSIPKRNFFACEAGRASVGGDGGTMLDGGGAPHEGQAVANELISLPHS